MSYDTEDLISMALVAIEENELRFFDEIQYFIGADVRTMYRRNCHECQEIKDALALNRLNKKNKAYKVLEDSDSPTAAISLIKLYGNEDERDALNGSQKANVEGDIKVTVTREVIKDVD